MYPGLFIAEQLALLVYQEILIMTQCVTELSPSFELHDIGADCFEYGERLIFFYFGLD